jgi:4-amino-4-deoxy-L-arabinose transferase-like glycosyltransferase
MKTSSRNALIFFIVLGTILRLWQLGFQNIWLEESYTLGVASLASPADIINYVVASEYNPPTYYLLAHYSLALFGWLGDAVAIRIPAFIAGVLLVPAMYLLGREYKDELAGVFCSGLVSILFPFVYYSQYARPYSLSFLVFAITLVFFIRIYRKSTTLDEHAFWILAGVNVWMHMFSIIPVGILALILLVQRPRARVAYALLPAAICLPIGQMFFQVSDARTIANGDYGYGPLMMVLMTPGEFFGVLFVVIGVLVIIYLWMKRDFLDIGLMVVVLWTITAGIWLSQFTPFFPRYYMTVALILVLMAGVAMTKMSEMIAFPSPEAAAMVIFTGFLLLQHGDFLTYYTIQKYASAPIFLPQLF